LAPSFCWSWQGKVVGISDGDTITVMRDGKEVKIRLYGVDTPESSQYDGQNAKQFTSAQVFDKTVEVESIDTDRYGRTVGLVTVGGVNLHRALVEYGYAWVYEQYCKRDFCNEWKKLEAQARDGKKGLWKNPKAQAPWEYRKNGKNGGDPGAIKQNVSTTSASTSGDTYHGNTNSRVFHQSSCRHYDCKNCTATFSTRDEAIKAGYKPCKICKP
jgi:endonuclease YncB( thermonuclease family)